MNKWISVCRDVASTTMAKESEKKRRLKRHSQKVLKRLIVKNIICHTIAKESSWKIVLPRREVKY